MKWILYALGFLAGQLTVLFGWMVWMDRRITKFSDRIEEAYGPHAQLRDADYFPTLRPAVRPRDRYSLTRAPKEPRP